MARLYPEYREEVQKKIIAAAHDIFHEKGYTNTKMSGIADSLGVTKPTIYNYFNTKENLFVGRSRPRASDTATSACSRSRSRWRCGPRLLLLDEPNAGMSVKESWQIVQRLRDIRRRDRLTIVIVEHDMEIVMQLAERITVLHHGRILAEGRPEDIARNPEVQRVYLGGR